ncbi:hypothetical protein GAG94_03765 [Lysinibacillus sphaericus]|uniref:hypothetical protein n=1 Tax=Lysinibacillus TaxID=400634 RepID=UPI0013B08CF2|nr:MULTISPECIES: hypothetical protein [Lysinibacillus]MBG9689518.1 hypothetical protein [Lysinibacillus sphaericus]MDC6267383.1 hypothetical protein [Lysinibacillus sphaericus]MDN4968183.1 hypothetical protein [Lysinibacillus fusiformis]MDN4968357.1 hypothetical protein [Lysinibacillus fusiformis]QIC46323.1 hypothetical protein GAG94_03765 [Lysinibacillus sphaericus]
MAIVRSEQEAERIIEELLQKGKGKYITQSVLFKKDSPQQLELLKNVLMRTTSFGEFARKALIEHLETENK